MFLVIDNAKTEKIIFYFLLNNKFVQRVFKTGRNANLAICLAKFLSKQKVTLKDIGYLGVVVGAGRFTAARLAVTFANTLAFALKIRVIGLPENFHTDPADIWLKKAKEAKVGRYVAALYSGEARVGPSSGRR